MQSHALPAPAASSTPAIEALQVATRDLLGVAMESLSASEGLTLTQMRLLFAIAEADGGSCSTIARRLGVAASTVTRMADRLHASGHVHRAQAPLNRSVVLLTLTDRGTEAIRAVLARREQVYRETLTAMDPAVAEQVTTVLTAIHEALAGLGRSDHHPLF